MISFTGHVAFDPKLRTTANGVAVLDIRVATTPRIKRGEEWEDGGTLWYDVVCWNKLASNVNDSVAKGDPVVVIGRLYNRVFDKVEQGTGVVTTVERLTVDAQSVGLDLNRFPAKVLRPERPEAALPQRSAPAVAEDTEQQAA
jgi:single-strand DNA-binding protein